MSRAERRHQIDRKKAKVMRVLRSWSPPSPKRDSSAIGRFVNHGLQVCSCYMCGNPRRHNKGAMTMQERRALSTEDAQ